MDARATARFVRISPRKVGQVSQLIRGRNVDEALHILQFTHKAGARVIEKVLKSAVSNAVNIEGKIDVDTLWIKEIRVGPGPTMTRFLPRALGRATPVLKRTSHITVIVTTP
ncbi:MAG: 50S ribosomal protein L22 [Latescibacteria bacterium DG_63]|nr:MAG: 50S ribosomal protein L22 [Latescibacteria bacterium DG_63]